MIICDTNIFIDAFNGRLDTIKELDRIGLSGIALSSVTVMELFQGARNKVNLTEIEKRLEYYDIIHFDEAVSRKALDFVKDYRLSHGLQIPDAIIGATAVVNRLPLYTYNLKDFTFLPGIMIHEPA